VGATGDGTAATASGATASRATGAVSSSTVNSHAGTCASPRLVRTAAVPSFTAVTVSGMQADCGGLLTGPSAG
jgi:hypothetical protein